MSKGSSDSGLTARKSAWDPLNLGESYCGLGSLWGPWQWDEDRSLMVEIPCSALIQEEGYLVCQILLTPQGGLTHFEE